MEPYEKEDKEFSEWAKSKSLRELGGELVIAHNMEAEYRSVRGGSIKKDKGGMPCDS